MFHETMILRLASRPRRRAPVHVRTIGTLLKMRPRDVLLLLQREKPADCRPGVCCLRSGVSTEYVLLYIFLGLESERIHSDGRALLFLL